MEEQPKCRKCGSVMVVKLNTRKAYHAACPTPEKHDAIDAKPTLEPAPTPVIPPVETPKEKSFLQGFF